MFGTEVENTLHVNDSKSVSSMIYFAPKLLVSLESSKIHVWDLENSTCLKSIEAYEKYVYKIAKMREYECPSFITCGSDRSEMKIVAHHAEEPFGKIGEIILLKDQSPVDLSMLDSSSFCVFISSGEVLVISFPEMKILKTVRVSEARERKKMIRSYVHPRSFYCFHRRGTDVVVSLFDLEEEKHVTSFYDMYIPDNFHVYLESKDEEVVLVSYPCDGIWRQFCCFKTKRGSPEILAGSSMEKKGSGKIMATIGSKFIVSGGYNGKFDLFQRDPNSKLWYKSAFSGQLINDRKQKSGDNGRRSSYKSTCSMIVLKKTKKFVRMVMGTGSGEIVIFRINSDEFLETGYDEDDNNNQDDEEKDNVERSKFLTEYSEKEGLGAFKVVVNGEVSCKISKVFVQQ